MLARAHYISNIATRGNKVCDGLSFWAKVDSVCPPLHPIKTIENKQTNVVKIGFTGKG